MHIYARELLDKYLLPELKEIAFVLGITPVGNKTFRETWIAALVGQPFPLFQSIEPAEQLVEISSGVKIDPVQESLAPAVKTSPGVDVDRAQEPIAPAAENFPGVECFIESNRNNFSGVERFTESNRNNFSGVERVQELSENSPGVDEVDSVSEAIASAAENSPGVKTEATVSESAIAPAAKNPILTGVIFSDRFLARYSPPQAQIIHFQSDADGQLSLLNFEIESLDEPPDPDDFESLDAFREALARWDCEHNEVSPEDNEPLQVSLESFCLWVPCPADWYESAALLELPSMLELSQTRKSSITSDFFIPIFGCLSDRPNRSDEPPDTGVFAKLPKPNSPSFPPATVGQAQLKPQPNAAQTQSKLIPNAYQTHTCCIVAAISNQPARSPPGGDAGF